MCATFPAVMPSSRPSSSFEGSRPSFSVSSIAVRRIRAILSTMCTGRRMVLDWLASARLIDCLIHQAA